MDGLLATLTKELVVDFGNHEGYEPSIGEDAPQGSGVEVPIGRPRIGREGCPWIPVGLMMTAF